MTCGLTKHLVANDTPLQPPHPPDPAGRAPGLLWIGWTEYSAWKAEQERLKSLDVWLESKAAPHPVAIDFASPTKPQPSVNAPLPVDAPLQEPRGG